MTKLTDITPEQLRKDAEAAKVAWAKDMMDKGGIESIVRKRLEEQIETMTLQDDIEIAIKTIEAQCLPSSVNDNYNGRWHHWPEPSMDPWRYDKKQIAKGAYGSGHQRAIDQRISVLELEVRKLRDALDLTVQVVEGAVQEMRDMLIFLELESVERRMP